MDKFLKVRGSNTSKHIASVSFGKDSLAMLLLIIEMGLPLDEVVFYDTGMEFQAIYDTRDNIKLLLSSKGIKYTELNPPYSFVFKMFDKIVRNRDGSGYHNGYSWCGGVCRWGTTDKLKYIDKYAEENNAMVYVGIAADETKRLEKERKYYKLFPLAQWNMAEAECLKYCYDNGYQWEEDGGAGVVRLYDILDRVSCWCCANKNLKELKNIFTYLPDYWERLKQLQSKTDRPMKYGKYSVFDLQKRFESEAIK